VSLSLACSSLGLGYLLVLELLLLSSLVVVRDPPTANSASSAYAACQASAEPAPWRVTSSASAASRSCWVGGILPSVVPSDLLETGQESPGPPCSRHLFQLQESVVVGRIYLLRLLTIKE
jgi:hypothetical protein